MSHKIHTFRAASMDEAMDLVHRSLGQDAVVVNSTPVESRGILWGRQQIEVTAQRAERRTIASSHRVPTGQQKLRTLAETQAARHAVQDHPTHLDAFDETPPHQFSSTVVPSLRPETGWSPAGTIESTNGSLIANGRQDRLVPCQHPPGDHDLLSSLYERLLEADVESDLAQELLERIRQQCSPLTQTAATMELKALLELEFRCSPPIETGDGQRQVIVLFGPTGVGKTTALAKLASHRLRQLGSRVGLISADCHRVGAFAQLQSQADLWQIPLCRAVNPVEMQSAIKKLSDVDLILIDTTGLNPRDAVKMQATRELIAAAEPDHSLLVLGLSGGGSSLVRQAAPFQILGATSLVLTKLDEAPGFGGLLSVSRKIPLPISYCSTSQTPFDPLEPAHPTRLARLILGEDQLNPG